MLNLVRVFGVCCALSLGGAAQAGVFYICNLPGQEATNWVSPQIGLIFDDAGQVTVIDGPILAVHEKPMVARISGNGDRLRMTWTLSGAKDSRGERVPTFSYVANFTRSTGAIKVIAKPVGYPQRFTGKGTCAAQKGKPNLKKILRR